MWPSACNVVELLGFKTVLVDISLDDFVWIPLLEEKITSRTKAVIVVHEFGQSSKLDSIIAICKT